MIIEAKKHSAPISLSFSVQDATALPYADDSLDTVVIANALHIMPEPEKALSETRRVLRPDGILLAPTFVQKDSFRFQLRQRMMELIGFHTYHKWTAEEYLAFLKPNGFSMLEHQLLGNGFMPECFTAGKPLYRF